MGRIGQGGRWLVGLGALLLGSSVALAVDNLCQPEEKPVFACSTGDDRLVSVCASKNLGEQAGYVQLRYGLPEHVDIAWPEASYPRRHVTRGELFYGGQMGRYLRFKMDRTHFVVFSVKDRGSGLVIEKDRIIVEKRLCREVGVADLKGIPVPLSEVLAVSGAPAR